MFESIKEFLGVAADFVTTFTLAHQAWAPLIIFVLGFAESLAFVSLLVPSTVILLALGAVIEVGGLPLMPLILSAAAGAFFGDWTSYTLGRWFKQPLLRNWPLKNMKPTIEKTETFMQKYGWFGVFFGRFIGPLRAIVPLIAGILEMPFLLFQTVNAASAICWAIMVLGGGAILGESFKAVRSVM